MRIWVDGREVPIPFNWWSRDDLEHFFDSRPGRGWDWTRSEPEDPELYRFWRHAEWAAENRDKIARRREWRERWERA